MAHDNCKFIANGNTIKLTGCADNMEDDGDWDGTSYYAITHAELTQIAPQMAQTAQLDWTFTTAYGDVIAMRDGKQVAIWDCGWYADDAERRYGDLLKKF